MSPRTHYDWTMLSCLARCEQEFVNRYVLHLNGPPTAAQHAGAALHAGLRDYFEGLNPWGTTLQAWGSASFPEKPALTGERLATLLNWYATAYPLAKDPWTVVQNERYVEHPLKPWCGIVDRVLRRKDDGRLAVMETKSTSMGLSAAWGRQWAYSGQLALQCDLVEALTGEPCEEAWVDGVFLSWRKEGPKAEDLQRFGPFPYPESLRAPLREERERLVERAQELESGWRAAQNLKAEVGIVAYRERHHNAASFDPPRRNGAYSGACFAYNGNCTFFPYCLLPREEEGDALALAVAVGSLQERPWEPSRRDA